MATFKLPSGIFVGMYGKSMMAEWLQQASQWHEMYCHDLEVMSLKTSRVELGVRRPSVQSCTWTKLSIASASVYLRACAFEITSDLSKIMWQHISLKKKSLMAEWLEQASQWHEMYCHDLEVMSLNPSRVELGVRTPSVLSRTWTKLTYTLFTYYGSPCLMGNSHI